MKLRSRIAIYGVWLLLTLISITCSSAARRNLDAYSATLTENKLWQIHQETRFTRFYYTNGQIKSGLMLRWQADSVLIQERGKGLPGRIATTGISRIETVTGNKSMKYLAVGAVVAGAYFAIVGGYDLDNLTFWSAIEKLFVPPAIIITAVSMGASRENKEVFIVPADFFFDYELTRSNYRRRK